MPSTLPKALFSAVLATVLASASASYASYPASAPAKAATAAMAEKPTTARMKLQSGAGAETVKVRAVYSPDVRPNPSADELDPDESGWRSYGMLLATLVLMGVIAVRRYKAGRP